MEATTSEARQRGLNTVGTWTAMLGLAAVLFSLPLSVGIFSSVGPVLFAVGAFTAVVGFAVRFDARRKLYNPQLNDPRFTPSR